MFSAAGVIPFAATILMVALATGVIFLFQSWLATLNLVSIIYLIPVLVVSLWWGTWPGIIAAIDGALAADFFFYPPLYSFWIGDTQNIADLIVFLIVALITGAISAQMNQRDRQILNLYDYSKRLAGCFTTADMIRATQEHLANSLGRPTILLAARDVRDETVPGTAVPQTVRDAMAAIGADDSAAHAIVDDASGVTWLARRILLGTTHYLVFVDLGINAMGGTRRLNRRIEAILTDAASYLMHLDLAGAIEQFRIQAQSDKLKSALVATVSHDLRTPLVSILGAASVLSQITEIANNSRARSLVESVYSEAARLDGNIKNLVDAARITIDVGRPNLELTDPVDIVHTATDQKKGELAAYDLEIAVAPDLPLVRVQPALIENALVQLLDNAIKYSPTGSKIAILGNADGKWLVLSVSDQGAGLTADERSHVGQRSFRSNRHAAAARGSGLGLWIANTFVAANGGKLEADSPGPGRGTTVRIYLPVAQDLPVAPDMNE